MNKKSLRDIDSPALEGQRALVRVDFNVPLRDGGVADDTRIRAALPTIQWLSERGCRVVLLSHLGRPKGERKPALSLEPVVGVLEGYLGEPVTFFPDPLDSAAVSRTKRLRRGQVALVENTRYWPGERANDEGFAASLATLGDFYVNDAFGTAHRAHASTEGLARKLMPAVAGFLMARELDYLGRVMEAPEAPFVAVIGGAKISGKIDVMESLLPRVDSIIVGGAMACTFFLAMGFEIGRSLVEPDRVGLAGELLARAGGKIVLPTGARIASELSADAAVSEVERDAIPADAAMFDIDQASIDEFTRLIEAAKTVVWNGPMGVFETPPFDTGTLAIANALARATTNGAVTVVGGGDSAAALASAGLQESISHLSTGGGASLEFLEGKSLPGVEALNDA